MIDKPKFLNDPKWYSYDENRMTYKVAEDAPKDVIESYDDYYSSAGVDKSEELQTALDSYKSKFKKPFPYHEHWELDESALIDVIKEKMR